MMTNSAPYDEKSWGETLKNYRKTTTTLPWSKGEFQPTDRVTTYQKSRQEREFNPVLMQFRDVEKESTVERRERAFAAVRLNEAKDKQLCFEQKFDIINHQSHLPQRFADASKQAGMMKTAKMKNPDTRLKYNLISHMGHEEHGVAKMVPKEGEEFLLRRDMDVTLEGGMKPKSHQSREFDVLTNKYIQNHTAREIEDFEGQRDLLSKKYWKSHDFDMLAVKYCDPAKQEAYEADLKAKERTHGVRQKEKLPKSIRYGEGNVYNIVNNEIKDGLSIGNLDRTRNKSVASKKGSAIEEQIRANATAVDDMMETRAMNRVNPSRFVKERQYGYDPITNISYKGRTGVAPAPIRQQMDKPIWNRLHSSSNQHGNNNFNINNYGGGNIVSNPRDLSGAPETEYNNSNTNNNNSNNNSNSNSNSNNNNNNNNNTARSNTARSINDAYTARSNTAPSPRPSFDSINKTVKPGFIPGLTIPAEGMIDGKLNLTAGGGMPRVPGGVGNSKRTSRAGGTGRTTGRSTNR